MVGHYTDQNLHGNSDAGIPTDIERYNVLGRGSRQIGPLLQGSTGVNSTAR